MRRFLLIAFGASLLIPTVAKAESVWLVYAGGFPTLKSRTIVLDKIQVQNEDQCHREGKKMIADGDFRKGLFEFLTYTCVKGK